jgi:hypothetical protein
LHVLNIYVEIDYLPSKLKFLIINDDYAQKFNIELPKKLIGLYFGAKFSNSIEYKLPNSLRYLSLNCDYYISNVFNVLPNNLIYLNLYNSHVVNYPKSLKYLKCSNYDNKITELSNLIYLDSHYWNLDVQLPNKIKFIINRSGYENLFIDLSKYKHVERNGNKYFVKK